MILYWVLGTLALQRVAELVHARRNARWLRSRGARLVREDGFAGIVVAHVLLFVLLPVEAWGWGVTYGPWTAAAAIAFLAGQALRYHAMITLGRRWNTRVYVLPGATLVRAGLYGRIRHPNYLGVMLEVVFLPLAFGLWRSAVVLGVLHSAALTVRIRCEERALAASGP